MGLRYNYTMNKANIRIPKTKIAGFCKRWYVSEFALFGSVLRPDFPPDSDVDIMLSFLPDAHITLFDMARMQEELQDIFKREVDLLSKRGVEHSRNYLRRKNILNSMQVIHVAR
ncbi:MAG: nucleotidyltransferase family protein [Chloroflexi bacterium]|nr:nucleotidyltransferase family protein [Chloroflexota bacterium]